MSLIKLFKEISDTSRFFLHITDESMFLFDNHSSSFHQFSEIEKELFLNIDNEGIFSKIERSQKAEYINEIYNFLETIINIANKPADPHRVPDKVSHIKLNLTNTCNLSCAYCFKEEGVQQKPEWHTIQKAIDYTLFESGKEADNQSIGFNLTSEPLLDMETMVLIRKYLNKITKRDPHRLRNVGLFFITNGTIADKKLVKSIKKIRNEPYIHVSIDGPESVHNKTRVNHKGIGTYKEIVSNLKLFRKKGLHLRAESVLTSLCPNPVEIIDHLISLGFEKINLKTVRSGTELSFNKNNIDTWEKGYRDYFQWIEQALLQQSYLLPRVLSDDFGMKFVYRILGEFKKEYRCFWAGESISMDYKGDFYPCESVLGVPECKLGDVEKGINWDKFYRDVTIEKRGNCKKCWARYLCGGTCYAYGVYRSGNPLEVDPIECRMNFFIIKESLNFIFKLIEKEFDLNILAALLQS